MSISFDAALGIHEKALHFRGQRAEVLANNIANADTPNYKARDLDFASVLAAQSAKTQGQGGLARTDSQHIAAESLPMGDATLGYRTPFSPSIDQNSVDLQQEQSSYAKNAIDFQASFTFLNNKFKGLTSALRGD